MFGSATPSEPPAPRASGSPSRVSGLATALVAALFVLTIGVGLALVYRAAERARVVGAPGRPAATPGRPVGAGGAQASGEADPGAELRVTRRFGATPMLERQAQVDATPNVLALLSREITVTTSYGGGFVGAIGGVASGYTSSRPVREDWFYYVNGLQSRVGAGDVSVHAGDRIWWDFHRWDFAASVPAVVGQFPAPFVAAGRAARATQVLYASGFEIDARRIASELASAGASVAAVAPADAASVARSGHVVLVGRWADLMGLSAVRDATLASGASGIFVRFDDSGADALDELGAVALHVPAAGAVLATAKPEDPDSGLWLVTGSGVGDVRAAADLLTDGGARLAGRFGALVEPDDAVVSLPIAVGR